MKIRILSTSDIHGYIMPINYADNSFVDCGFLSILNTIEEYKTENTLLIDNGDTIHGSPFLTYYYDHQEGINPIDLCLKDYDYVNIGNHDFGYGKKQLKQYINDLNNRYLCGNVKMNGITLGKEYVIHEFDKDNRVAIIGCVSQCVLQYESKENIEGIEIEDCYGFCKRVIKKIKENENVNATIVVYHGGLEVDQNGEFIQEDNGENQGYRMCKDLDFDILISGHQHMSLNTKLFSKVVTQCKENGKEFVLIDYDLETKQSHVELIKPKGYSVDLYNALLPLENSVQKWLDEPVGIVENVDLKIHDGFDARLHKSPLISFINEAQRELVNADLSGSALFNNAVGFNSRISIRDLISTYVYTNTVYKVKINGKQLREYLEVDARYFDISNDEIVVSEDYLKPTEKHFNYDMVDGVEYTIKVSNPRGQRIITLKHNGIDVKDDDEFSLAISNFRYGGSGGFDVFKNTEVLQASDEDMIVVLANYLMKNKITFVNHIDNIKVIK